MSTFKQPNPEESTLISTANKFSGEESDRRDVRYERRRATQSFTKLKRLADCGNTAVGQVYLGKTGNQAHFIKLATCGSVWACSVCSAKVLAARTNEVSLAIESWEKRGGQLVFETLTIAHSKSDSLKKVWRAVSRAFTAINGGTYSIKNKSFGQVGYLKVVEVTHGRNGWHVHLHVLRFIERPLDTSQLNEWSSVIFNKWSSSLKGQGFRSPTAHNHKFDLVLHSRGLERYLFKSFDNSGFLEGEVNSGNLIQGGKGVWALLDGAIGSPTSKERVLWHEWEAGSHGKRQVSWSQGLRELLGLGEPKNDHEIVENGDAFVPLIGIGKGSVSRLGRLGRVQSRILRAVERGDIFLACQMLSEHGIIWWLTPDALSNPLFKNQEEPFPSTFDHK